MAVKLEFYISDNDCDRLFAIKKKRGEDDKTGNQFAKELLESTLYQLHPKKVEDSELD